MSSLKRTFSMPGGGLIQVSECRIEWIGSAFSSAQARHAGILKGGTFPVKGAFADGGDSLLFCFCTVQAVNGRGAFRLRSGVVRGKILFQQRFRGIGYAGSAVAAR